jgi:choice-of-anchor B domain-containing protein
MKKLLFATLLLLATGFSVVGQNFNMELKSTLTFPGQTLANICGYVQDGKEYALVGASQGLVIVDITDPANPNQIVQIPGPDNLWKEIKVYQHYAYITSEGGGGVQIVDMSNLPSSNLQYHNYNGDGPIANNLVTIHALHIDTNRGFLYAYGSNAGGGAIVLDLNTDPYNPTYAGQYQGLQYIHDGYADNDTLYGCHIYTGLLSIVDMNDKANPNLLGTVQTPGKFTHNAWLTDDHLSILTTDETTPSFLTSYDISDPTDIKELDRFSTNDGYGSLGHNTHILNDWAITSWYSDGLTIVDAHKPDNLVMTGWYDTWPGTGANFDGCWGAYPFFPSGTVIASNIEPGELFILAPTYVRACYLEGTVTNSCTGMPEGNVSITINGGIPQSNANTKNNGVFKTGQAEPGDFEVTVSKAGFVSQTFNVTFVPGQVFPLDVNLEPNSGFNVHGTVKNNNDGLAIPNTSFTIASPTNSYMITTDGTGEFDLSCVPAGDYVLGSWGFQSSSPVTVSANGNVEFTVQPGYYDAFAIDLGWTTTSTADEGHWERGEPKGTQYQGAQSNPDVDVATDDNDQCYVTGNGGGAAATYDVDNGIVTLTSPVMKLAGYDEAELSFYYWFFNEGGSNTPNDQLVVTANNGIQTVTLLTIDQTQNNWQYSGIINLSEYIALTDNMRIQFTTSDLQGSGNIVEAAVDVFQVNPLVSSGSQQLDTKASMLVSPNPSSDVFVLNYSWETNKQTILQISNVHGQLVESHVLGQSEGQFQFGQNLPTGMYSAQLVDGEKRSAAVKLIKTNN